MKDIIEKQNSPNNPIKMITHHRALTYLLQNRTIASYAKMMKKEYQNADLITGTTSWCDFLSDDEWGEIVLIHQKNLPVQWLRTHVFSFNVKEVEERYKVQIDPKSIPPPMPEVCMSPTIRLDTQSAIRVGLEKKLNKSYPYLREGYSSLGTLILSIFDPHFGGFNKDLEIQCNTLDLESLKQVAGDLSVTSSFKRVLLVDGLTPFEENPANCVYELFPS
jgi:hypothetical protein